jgi:hypothetical protein
MPLKIITAVLLIAISINCIPYRKPPKYAQYLFEMSTSEQVEQIKKYSLEEQYDLFLYFNHVVRPPCTHLADPITEAGPTVVPFLKAKLEASKERITIASIIDLFYEMAWRKRYDYSRDPELVSLIKLKTNSMGDGPLKDFVLYKVSRIAAEDKEKATTIEAE